MRIVISWYSDNCVFQATYNKEQLPAAKKLFYDQLGRFYDTAYLDILWRNLELEFERDRIAEYGDNYSYAERILSTFCVTYLT